jgi:hypothetical protein
MYLPAVEQRLLLQANNEVHYGTRFGAAIQKIACGYEVGLTTAPIKADINDAGFLKRCYEGIVSAMNVTDRNDSFDVRKMPVIRLRL